MKILHVLTKLFCSVSLFGWLLAGSHLEGQTFTQLHSLSAAEGSPITGRLILATADGNFYGTAQQGGNNGTGTFFRITPAGAFTVLHSFGSNVGEGNYPYAGLVQGSDGNFYGTTTSPSTIFKITPGGTLTTLYTLGAADGATPFGALVEGTNGTFYGTTYVGGAEADGTVFKVTTDGTPAGTTFTSLHSFPTQSGGMNVGGANPTAGMVSSGDGNFIGTTFSGGANSRGTIFKITPAGDFTTLYEFTVATGGECRGKFVRDSSGVFYGTSTTGLGQGAVFQVVTDGTAANTQVSVLYNFNTLPDDSDGAALGSGVAIDSEGDLYGMTDLGGANSNGTLFRLTPNGPLTTLHAFSSSTTEAQVHAGVIFGSGGILYGSTKTTIFKFEPGSSAPPPPVHGGMSDTVFKVKKLPPVTPGGDSVLHFSALQTGTPEGLKVRVQSNNVADNNRNDWVDLNNGSAGYMTVDKTTQKFVLSSTNYPLANGIYFRALSTASAYPDSKSNIVGPFNLSGTQNHLGFTTLFVATNGPGQEMNFRGSVAVDQATITLYIQATTTPDNDASWVGLNDGRAGQMHPYADPLRFYLDTTSYPPGDPVYFRAVAKAVGFVDSISNVIGVINVIVGTPPTTEVLPPFPQPGSQSGLDYDHPIIAAMGTLSMGATASSPEGKTIKKLGLIYDGATIDVRENGAENMTTQYHTNVPGDHVIKAFAIDERGIVGYADPVYIRIKPVDGKVFTMMASGDWSDPANWHDDNGNPGIPGFNDFAIVGALNATIAQSVSAFAVSLNGGSINGAGGQFSIDKFFSVAAGQLKNINLTVNVGAIMALVGDTNVPMSGSVTNNGTIKLTGRGGIVPVPSGAKSARSAAASSIGVDGFFDGIAAFFKNAGDFIFHRHSTPPKTTPPPATPPAVPAPHGVLAAKFENSGRLITNDGAGVISNDGGSVISNDGGSLIGQDGAGLITQDGGSVVSHDGGSLIGNDGASLITNDGAGRPALRAAAAAAAVNPSFVQTSGETDLKHIQIVSSVILNGGTLSGSGVIIGSLTNNSGFISPGHSAGTIAVTGDFTQAAGGTLIVENGGPGFGQLDQLQVGGTASLGGNLHVKTIGGYVLVAADTFSPLGYGAVTGAFNSTSDNASLTLNATGALISIDPAAPQPQSAKPANISTRMRVLTNDKVLIGGFIVTGPNGSTKKVLIRGLGPTLGKLGVPGSLSDPFIELHYPNNSVVSNDDWAQAANHAQIPVGFQPDPKESALLVDLAPGAYTVIEQGAHGETGIGLAEIYDFDGSNTVALANISTRGFIDTGDNVMIGGFIVDGTEPAQILVRATGPTLTQYGISGALADPELELHDANGNVFLNDDWRETQEAEIQATTIPPSDNKEPAVLATLVPGSYTAIVRGKDNTTGIGLVEAYKIK